MKLIFAFFTILLLAVCFVQANSDIKKIFFSRRRHLHHRNEKHLQNVKYLEENHQNILQQTPFSPLTLRGLNYIKYQLFDTWDPEDKNESWRRWYATENPDGNSALRYTIAHLGYTAALAAKVAIENNKSSFFAANISHHREAKHQQQKEKLHAAVLSLAVLSLQAAIERMIDSRVWSYISMFPEFVAQPSYPDPVAYKNVMYSGHLAQLISLYENLSGDKDTYSVQGWYFSISINGGNQSFTVHYNTSKLILAIWSQMGRYASGGVPCEPDSVFIICNSFSNNAFVLFDKTHGTNFHTAQNKSMKWFDSIERFGIINKLDNITKQYFALDYLLFPGVWEPLASEGSDSWALSFQAGWWPEHKLDLLTKGYTTLRDSTQWVINETTKTAEIIQEKKNPIGKMLFPFPDDITTSFFPMIWQQFNSVKSSSSSSNADDRGRVLASYSLNYFVSNFQQTIDDCRICIRYNSSANYRDWVTANVVAGQVLLEGAAYDSGILRRMFQEGFY